MLGIEPLVDRLGALGDGPFDTAHCTVDVVTQPVALACLPQGLEGELHQGQVAGLLAHVVEQAVHQARVEAQSHLLGGRLDGAGQLLGGHLAEVDLGLGQPIGQPAVQQGLTVEVGP